MAKVAILMGSKSDFAVVKPAVVTLQKFGIETQVRVISAHRTPDAAHAFAANAEADGVEAIICAAGKAAHLGGVIAAYTTFTRYRASREDRYDGRFGQPALHRANAFRYPGRNCRGKRG